MDRMRRVRLAIAAIVVGLSGAVTSLAQTASPTPAPGTVGSGGGKVVPPANAATATFVVGMQRGPWKLTDITMNSLLFDGYQIVATETLLTLSSGIVVGGTIGDQNNNLTMQANAGGSESSYLGYYLKKGPTLFRCTEEGLGAKMVYCWNFAPERGEINGVSQRDLNPNALLGTWVGTVFPDALNTSGRGTMTSTQQLGNYAPSTPIPVTYTIEANTVSVNDVKGELYTYTFQIESDDWIRWVARDQQTLHTVGRFHRVGQRF